VAERSPERAGRSHTATVTRTPGPGDVGRRHCSMEPAVRILGRRALHLPSTRRAPLRRLVRRGAGRRRAVRPAGRRPAADDVDPVAVAADLPRRYDALWTELTREELFRRDEQRYRVAQRINRLNELGFDVDELELITTEAGTRLRVHTQVAESGRHRDQLFTRTGLRATENQARRMLNDVISFRGYLEQKEGRRSRRPLPRIAGAPRSSTRCWPWCRGSCRTGWPPPRCSTRSSSTAGSCPSRLVPTSAPRPRRGPW
jgi:Domain of unknown function (DUF4032)